MSSSNSSPHFLQGPEIFPAEGFMAYNTNLARNGAAIVTIAEWDNPNQRTVGMPDSIRMQRFDLTDPSVHNYFCQLADDIHFYGSKLMVGTNFPPMFSPLASPFMEPMGGMGGREIPVGKVDEMIATLVEKLKMYQSFGYDGVSIRLEMFMSPRFNNKKDEYGGSVENGTRFPLQLCQRIKEELGQDFLIEAMLRGEQDHGHTLEDTVAFAKMAEGKIDIFQIRESNKIKSHPTGYHFKPGEHKTIQYAEAIKKSGAKVIVEPIGGFQDLDEIEGYIASGKADMIGMARAFIADPEYSQKAYEGRGEDVVPCIMCCKCHGTMFAPWLSFCSVNPLMGNEHKLHRMVAAPGPSKKVAIIGGGVAGMEAAIVAAQRGHKVTLYEKSDYLGGQMMMYGDYASFKWPIKRFREYLIRQIGKLGIEVQLSTEATPNVVQSGGFDAVLAATGAEPNIPDIPGLKDTKVWTCLEVYGHEQELGKNVVIVGGSEAGTETGMYLAENGHNVTVLTRQDKIAHDAAQIHTITMVWISYEDGKETEGAAWEKYDNFHGITRATTTAIAEGRVTYQDADGHEKTIEADSIVICGGMKPRQVEALSFASAADRFFVIGDCSSVGNIQRSMRSAYAAASQL
jgi:NADPH-dependent 2,4-dienoyl-CoA reductase/sulfur reductase-like enzyme